VKVFRLFADVHVPVIDMPALLAGFRIATGG
jgi:hypothetical protein